jgi:hypothetical protein
MIDIVTHWTRPDPHSPNGFSSLIYENSTITKTWSIKVRAHYTLEGKKENVAHKEN